MSDLPPRVEANPEGGAVLSELQAKQGRVGAPVLVVLAVSTLLAIAVLFGAWILMSAGRSQDQGQSRAPPAASRSFNTPPATPKQAPGPGPSP